METKKTAAQFDVPSIRRAVVRFMLACTKDMEKGQDPVPPHVAEANAHLAELEVLDPRTVGTARRFLIR